MSPESPSVCRTCGRPISAEAAAVGCPYCLLRLGLTTTSGATQIDGEFPAGSLDASAPRSERFLRQGVLPSFGDYELESEIARGGMGVVYRARQRSLNRTVAVKMILAGQLASPESVQRFRLEAEAAAGLHHPGIVPIYEVGEYDTQHFFSMELIEGVSLAECMDDFRLAAQGNAAAKREQQVCIAELVAGVARALDFAHQRGVLHRDLKPSNILIDEQGRPHLTDFGLAKLTGRESSGLTLTVAVMGTPGYLAPEQALGRDERMTTAVDVYGLGATLYELLTGSPPFQGATALETMRMAVEREPTPPRKLNPAVDRDLETIALRCLEKAPERRYPSAAALAEELERFVRREPILARPVGRVEQAWRWCRRYPWPAALAGALLTTILVGSGLAFWQWARAEFANATLKENLGHLEWNAIDVMLQQGQSSRAIAKLASLLRSDPNDWKAAMLAMSVLEQRRFPIPAAPAIRHPGGTELAVARLNAKAGRIVTASFDATARLWNAATSQQIAVLKHDAPVTWAEFRPDGTVVATCSRDKTVRLWDSKTGDPIGPPRLQEAPVERITFSDDGRYLLICSAQGVSILDGTDGRLLIGPIRLAGKIVKARFLADQAVFFVAQLDGDNSKLRVWNLPGGAEQPGLDVEAFRDADVNDDLTHAAVVDAAGVGRIMDFPSGGSRKQLVDVNGMLLGVRFGIQGDFVVGFGRSQWARVWDARTAQPISVELQHYYTVNGVSLLENDERLLTWSDDSSAQIRNVVDGSFYCESMRHPHRVIHAEVDEFGGEEVCLTTISHLKSRSEETKTGAAYLWKIHDGRNPRDRLVGDGDFAGHDGSSLSADGRLLAYGTTDGRVHVVDRVSGVPVCGPFPVVGGAWGNQFTPDGTKLIVASSRGQVSVWTIPEGKLVAEPVKLPTTFQPLEISPDGREFATGSIDHIVRVWSVETGRVLREMRHGSEINSVAYSPDGRLLASAGEDRVVRIWNPATGELVRNLIGHQNEVMTVFFSPDGKRLLTGSLDFTARIWDGEMGSQQALLPHQGDVIDVGFSPDGRLAATASRDRTAVIWDVITGLPHTRPMLHEQAVRNVRFSADGKRLLTMDFRSLRVWDVETSHPLTVRLKQPMLGGTGFQNSSTRVAVTPDGQAAFVASDSLEARLWNFTTPAGTAPSWFPEFLEAIAGQRFAQGADLPEAVPPERFTELQARLRDSTATDDYTHWCRQWLFERSPGRPN